MTQVWEVTNLIGAKTLAAKLRRRGYPVVRQRGTTLYVGRSDGHKPWAELAGHMTNSTDIRWVREDVTAF